MGFSPITDESELREDAGEDHGRSQEGAFRPEFLNRLDDIIVFRSLTKTGLDRDPRIWK